MDLEELAARKREIEAGAPLALPPARTVSCVSQAEVCLVSPLDPVTCSASFSRSDCLSDGEPGAPIDHEHQPIAPEPAAAPIAPEHEPHDLDVGADLEKRMEEFDL